MLTKEELEKYINDFYSLKKEIESDASWDGNVEEDAVNPNHYKLPNGMQVVDVEVAMLGKEAVQEHCLCTAVEYILRHKGKNGAEDIRKAHWWLSKWVELEDAHEEATTT